MRQPTSYHSQQIIAFIELVLSRTNPATRRRSIEPPPFTLLAGVRIQVRNSYIMTAFSCFHQMRPGPATPIPESDPLDQTFYSLHQRSMNLGAAPPSKLSYPHESTDATLSLSIPDLSTFSWKIKRRPYSEQDSGAFRACYKRRVRKAADLSGLRLPSTINLKQ